MIVIHRPAQVTGPLGESLDRYVLPPDAPIPDDALWIDLIEPTQEEDRLVEAHLNIEIPTRVEMSGIEPSEILYNENNARYMTARVLCNSETDAPKLIDVSFILTEKGARDRALWRAALLQHVHVPRGQAGGCRHQPEAVLDGSSRRSSTAPPRSSARSGRASTACRRDLRQRPAGSRRAASFRAALKSIGRKGDIISNVRESMVSVERLLLFLSASMPRPQKARGYQAEWRTALRDVQSIEEHATFLSNKIQFLLDATLGLVTIEQNDIIKIFSVMSVIFLPPTLVSSIYGMNFKFMPELEWQYGYLWAILLIILAAGAALCVLPVEAVALRPSLAAASRHGRPCAGHPRLQPAERRGMPGTRPGMTTISEKRPCADAMPSPCPPTPIGSSSATRSSRTFRRATTWLRLSPCPSSPRIGASGISGWCAGASCPAG
jgi:magnesium transporter